MQPLMNYLAVFEKTDNGYSAYLPDLPGCIAAGDTLEETENLIKEAVTYGNYIQYLASYPSSYRPAFASA